jgi:DNA (cytosine-5)-methyltransferase 1
VIRRTLQDELGYSNLHYRILDARAWVPQHRERIFIVGFRDGNDFSFDQLQIPDPTKHPRMGMILHPEDGSEPLDEPFTLGPRGAVNPKYTLTDRLWEYLQNYAEKHRRKGNGFGFGLAGPGDVARTLSARYYKDGSEILIPQQGRNPRRLTPRECARLMGFEQPGCTDFVIPVSDTQAYRQFGNAVVAIAAAAIAKSMFKYLPVQPGRQTQRRLPLRG